jgi:hypothetical protein
MNPTDFVSQGARHRPVHVVTDRRAGRAPHVNTIIERKEFLEMLTEMETTRSTLNRDFKKAVAGIRLLSERLH